MILIKQLARANIVKSDDGKFYPYRNITKLEALEMLVASRGWYMEQTIESILETPSQVPYDITVVNDGSTDGCCAFLQSRGKTYSRVKLINTTGVGAANARNLGARQSSGEVLFFCDAHITVEEDWLDLLTEDVMEEGTGAVSPGIANMNQIYAVGYGLIWNEAMEARWLPGPGGIVEVPFAPVAVWL